MFFSILLSTDSHHTCLTCETLHYPWIPSCCLILIYQLELWTPFTGIHNAGLYILKEIRSSLSKTPPPPPPPLPPIYNHFLVCLLKVTEQHFLTKLDKLVYMHRFHEFHNV